jgi:hypothetical protein
MQKKVLSLMSLVLVGALFAGCIDFGGKTEEETEDLFYVTWPNYSWEWYENAKYGLRFKYPSSWGEAHDHEPMKDYLLINFRTEDDCYAPADIHIYGVKRPLEESVQLFLELYEKDEDIKNFEVESYENITLDGVHAIKVVSRSDKLRDIKIDAQNKGWYYSFSFGLSTDNLHQWDEWVKLVDEILSSFEFI